MEQCPHQLGVSSNSIVGPKKSPVPVTNDSSIIGCQSFSEEDPIPVIGVVLINVCLLQRRRFFFPAKQRRDLTEGRDERAEGDDARFGEEFGHFGDAPDVLLAVGVGEAQVLVETEAHVVAVETERRYAPIHQVVLQRERQRRLARARQSCRFKL